MMSDNTNKPEGQRIIVTRNFDQTDKIGYLQLRPGIEIPPDTHLALGYTVADTETHVLIKKIDVHEVSLVSNGHKKRDQKETTKEDILKGLGPVSIEIGSEQPVTIEKLFGPTIFSDLRITADAKTCEWVIERQWIKSSEWLEWVRIPGQISQEVTEQEDE